MKKINFLFNFILPYMLFTLLGSITFASAMGNSTIDESLAVPLAVAYMAYPDDGKFPTNVMHPGDYLHGHNYVKDEKRSTTDISVFVHDDTKKVLIGYRGLNCRNTLMAALGSFSQYGRADFDAVLRSYFPLNLLVKPYSVVMAMSFLTTILLSLNCIYPDFNWTPKFLHETIYSWYRLSCSFAVLSGIFGATLLTNALAKFSYQSFDGDILNIREQTKKIVEHYKQLGYTCEMVGHSLGALRAKMMSGILKDAQARVFSCPAGAYELLLGFGQSHKELMEKGIPGRAGFEKNVTGYIVTGDSLASAKKEEEAQNHSIPQSYGHPHKILPLWIYIMNKLGMQSIRAGFQNTTPPSSPETKPKEGGTSKRCFRWLPWVSTKKNSLQAVE